MDRDMLIRRHAIHCLGPAQAERTLLFVHGFGTDQQAWSQVADAFADRYRVLLLDNAGAGQADPAAFVQSRYLNLNGYACDLIEIVSAFDLHHLSVIGHSFGAMIAALAVPQMRARCDSLVLLGASPHYLNEADYSGGMNREDVDAIYSAITGSFTQWADSFAPLAFAGSGRPDLAARLAASIKTIPEERVLTVMCSIFQSDYRAQLASLDLPTLIVQTGDDAFVPRAVADYMQRQIRGSQLEILPAQGHLPHLTHPELVIAALRPFLA